MAINLPAAARTRGVGLADSRNPQCQRRLVGPRPYRVARGWALPLRPNTRRY